MNGYMGQILDIQLDKSSVGTIDLDQDLTRLFLGGGGLAARILYDLIDPTIDPLSTESPLLYMTGPLTGTLAPCTGRHVICGRSPLTGLWGETYAGGHFGMRLKSAGYDGILIRGRSEIPVYLYISDDYVEVRSAEHIWGKTTSESRAILREELGNVQVSCIGPAGENLVRFAGVMNNERANARCGMGAVMGSKYLKGVAVKGDKRVNLADVDGFVNLTRESSKVLSEVMTHLRDSGTAMYVDIGADFNDMPIKYFQESEWDDISDLSVSVMNEFLTGRSACHSCPIACGRKITLPEFDLHNVGGPEYQTVAAFGSNLLISDLRKISLMNHLCNEYGMDTISCGSTIGFATLISEMGKMDVDLEWGNPDKVIDIIHAIANREGVGNDLAEGVMRLSQKYNAEDHAIHVKGLEVPNHDPRAFGGMATVYAMSSRGASHLEGDMYSVDMGVEVRELGIISGDRLEDTKKGEIAARAQDFRAFFDSVIMCHFAIVPINKIVSMLNLAIGASYTLDDVLKIGARSVTIKRLINLSCGLRPEQDTIPKPLLQPLPDDATFGFVPDVESQVSEYYEYRKWDRETGQPSPEALKKLDIP